jgi:hypothetical protein
MTITASELDCGARDVAGALVAGALVATGALVAGVDVAAVPELDAAGPASGSSAYWVQAVALNAAARPNRRMFWVMLCTVVPPVSTS